MELNLVANNKNEEVVLKYLKLVATDVLAEKINTGKKTLQGCWNYIVGEAKKKAVSGCACIEDKEVFGLAVHYFEEDSIKEQKSAPPVKTVTSKDEQKHVEKEKPKAPKKDALEGQIMLFDDLFG